MKFTLISIFCLTITTNAIAQDISFSDEQLKWFLIQKDCIDTDDDGIPDLDADLNNDNEIQQSEAESIKNLTIGDFPDTYFITSVADLAHFINLDKLTIIHNDSLPEITSLNLSNLSFLWIGSCKSLKYIDLSDLPNIADLRIEDINNLDYLNLENGSFASGIFSLFYTDNIKYACVDSIFEEYHEVSYHMLEGEVPSLNCATAVESANSPHDNSIWVYPNPTNGILTIEGLENKEKQIAIFDLIGNTILKTTSSENTLNTSDLLPGLYFIRIESDPGFSTVKQILKL